MWGFRTIKMRRARRKKTCRHPKTPKIAEKPCKPSTPTPDQHPVFEKTRFFVKSKIDVCHLQMAHMTVAVETFGGFWVLFFFFDFFLTCRVFFGFFSTRAFAVAVFKVFKELGLQRVWKKTEVERLKIEFFRKIFENFKVENFNTQSRPFEIFSNFFRKIFKKFSDSV